MSARFSCSARSTSDSGERDALPVDGTLRKSPKCSIVTIAIVDVDYTTVGRLLSNRGRSRMIGLLLDRGSVSASELARCANLATSTASGHLQQLVAGGLVAAEPRGRHRLFRIASSAVADCLEALSPICAPVEILSLRSSSEARALHFARTCYDHLARVLGVAILDAMVSDGWLEEHAGSYVLGPESMVWSGRLGIDLGSASRSHRPFIRSCLDWTVRRPHLGGGLGAALCEVFFERGWVKRAERRRGVAVTDLGKRGFKEMFCLDVEDLDAGQRVGSR